MLYLTLLCINHSRKLMKKVKKKNIKKRKLTFASFQDYKGKTTLKLKVVIDRKKKLWLKISFWAMNFYCN